MSDIHSASGARVAGGVDAPNLSPVAPADDARTILVNNVSWGGVLAGVVAGLVTQLILNLIGIGIGASTLNPTTGDNPTASGFSIGAGIWWALSGIIAAFVGGYIASRLSGRPKASTGAWHGLTSWALTTLVVFYLLTTAVGIAPAAFIYNSVGRELGTMTSLDGLLSPGAIASLLALAALSLLPIAVRRRTTARALPPRSDSEL